MTDEEAFRGKVRVNGRTFKLYHRKGGKWFARAGAWGRYGLAVIGAKTKDELMGRLEEWGQVR